MAAQKSIKYGVISVLARAGQKNLVFYRPIPANFYLYTRTKKNKETGFAVSSFNSQVLNFLNSRLSPIAIVARRRDNGSFSIVLSEIVVNKRSMRLPLKATSRPILPRKIVSRCCVSHGFVPFATRVARSRAANDQWQTAGTGCRSPETRARPAANAEPAFFVFCSSSAVVVYGFVSCARYSVCNLVADSLQIRYSFCTISVINTR